MHYVISARRWTSSLQERFGDPNSIFFLSEEDVLQVIGEFGVALILDEAEGIPRLEFQNDVD